ncbi:MAG: hypothetical protein JXR40_13025 [Pontiellaceae bacterium]|nr:hypothetical protein [Pontiellaceae bacterium]
MKRKSYFLGTGALVLFLAGVCRGEQEYNRERYQIIIDRSPFGKTEVVVVAQAPTGPTEREIQNLESQYRLTFLMKSETDGEMRAGFQNLKPQAGESKSEIISINETYNGIKLINVDLARSTASVEFEGRVMKLEMKAVKQPVRRGRNTENNVDREPMVTVEVVQLSPEELAQLREENLMRSREIQMDVLRKGQPPLPVALTQEMDDQLVFEGVLPPLE